MTESIIAASISVFGSLLGTFGGIIVSSKLLNYRVEQLEKKVEKHNNLVERMYKVEGDLDLIDEKIKVANNRIQDLENKTEVI